MNFCLQVYVLTYVAIFVKCFTKCCALTLGLCCLPLAKGHRRQVMGFDFRAERPPAQAADHVWRRKPAAKLAPPSGSSGTSPRLSFPEKAA